MTSAHLVLMGQKDHQDPWVTQVTRVLTVYLDFLVYLEQKVTVELMDVMAPMVSQELLVQKVIRVVLASTEFRVSRETEANLHTDHREPKD